MSTNVHPVKQSLTPIETWRIATALLLAQSVIPVNYRDRSQRRTLVGYLLVGRRVRMSGRDGEWAFHHLGTI